MVESYGRGISNHSPLTGPLVLLKGEKIKCFFFTLCRYYKLQSSSRFQSRTITGWTHV